MSFWGVLEFWISDGEEFYIYILENDSIYVEISINFGVLIALIGCFHLFVVDFTFTMLTSLNCCTKFFIFFQYLSSECFVRWFYRLQTALKAPRQIAFFVLIVREMVSETININYPHIIFSLLGLDTQFLRMTIACILSFLFLLLLLVYGREVPD